MTRVVVNRKQWHTRPSYIDSALRVGESRRMCCLGFAARQAGCEGLTGVDYPDELDKEEYKKFQKAFPTLNRRACVALATINDDEVMTRKEKAEKITTLGQKHGVEFVFV